MDSDAHVTVEGSRRIALGRAGAPREAGIRTAVLALVIASMAVDHLLGDDPGLEDPPAFLIACVLSLALAAFLFGRVVPRAKAAAERAARDGLTCSVLAAVPGIAAAWLGLPFVLAGAGIVLGLAARDEKPSRRATAAILIGTLVLFVLTANYAVQAIEKAAA